MSNEQELVLHKKLFRQLTTDELYELLRVRSEVFVVEQNCVYQDLDGRSCFMPSMRPLSISAQHS